MTCRISSKELKFKQNPTCEDGKELIRDAIQNELISNELGSKTLKLKGTVLDNLYDEYYNNYISLFDIINKYLDDDKVYRFIEDEFVASIYIKNPKLKNECVQLLIKKIKSEFKEPFECTDFYTKIYDISPTPPFMYGKDIQYEDLRSIINSCDPLFYKEFIEVLCILMDKLNIECNCICGNNKECIYFKTIPSEHKYKVKITSNTEEEEQDDNKENSFSTIYENKKLTFTFKELKITKEYDSGEQRCVYIGKLGKLYISMKFDGNFSTHPYYDNSIEKIIREWACKYFNFDFEDNEIFWGEYENDGNIICFEILNDKFLTQYIQKNEQ